ncbi:nuclease-related domain-containing protein [Oceanobacillus sp. CFH 90083]|uniref:nuclease-related domain-containing protein n=1 Tax=Oceanobacillus sp. CFH 90083 TaxID=2592336 RepID=UPI00128C63BF|nr:nuclease-related domain-containing protein [Oceanobacillus sp. CFH 90083]
MAQLIKLQDYISRYAWDTYRYPTQYIRQKKEQWECFYSEWLAPSQQEEINIEEHIEVEDAKAKNSFLQKWKERFIKSSVSVEDLTPDEEIVKRNKPPLKLPETEEALKQVFLDRLLEIQLKWASSTVSQVSVVDSSYYNDPLLRFLLQRFPDTYLVMYRPIFAVKQAAVETDIILITPIGIEILSFVELETNEVIMAGDERTWTITAQKNEEPGRLVNPLISLKRSEKWIERFLKAENINIPIKKVVISRTNHILYATAPYQTEIIDKLTFPEWFQEKRTVHLPLKKRQLNVAESLLRNSLSYSFPRPEWEEE